MTTTGAHIGAVVAAGAAAVAALVVIGPLLGSSDADGDDAPPVTTETTPTIEQPPPPIDPSARMQVAAAGVRELLLEEYPSGELLWVRDQVCKRWNNQAGNPNGCTDLTEREMAELERLLPAYAIAWVEDDRGLYGSHLERGGHPLYLELCEPKTVSADGRSVFVWALAGGRNCAGTPYEVQLREDGPPDAEQGNEFVIC